MFYLQLGPFVVKVIVRCEKRAHTAEIEKQCAIFPASTGEHHDIEVYVFDSPVAATALFAADTRQCERNGIATYDSFCIRDTHSLVTASLEHKLATFIYPERGLSLASAFLNDIRIVVSLLTLKAGGLPLHSCACRVDAHGKAVLFLGKSGAGKSTIGELLARNGWLLINDEFNLVVPSSNSRSYEIWQTPLCRRSQMVYSTIETPSHLLQVFSLEKARRLGIESLSASYGFFLITQSVTMLPATPEIGNRMLANAERFCESVPVKKLKCNKNVSVADFLMKAVFQSHKEA